MSLVFAILQFTRMNKILSSVVTVPFLTASLLGYLLSHMVRVVDCHTGILGSNPGGLKIFSPWIV